MKRILATLAVCSLLVAVLFFPAAPAVGCNSVGVATPAFSLTAPVYSQAVVQQPVYAQQLAFAAPVFAEQFVAQPFLQVALGGYGQAFRQRQVVQRVVVPERVIVRAPRVKVRVR